MQIPLINKILDEKFVRAIFVFPPATIPVNSLGEPDFSERSTSEMYATFVYDFGEHKFGLLEFDSVLLNSLLEAKKSNKKLSKTLWILSRDPSGQINIDEDGTVDSFVVSAEEKDKFQMYLEKLPEKYKQKKKYKMHR